MHLRVRRDIGPGAVQDELHGRVAFEGEGQHHLLAEEFLPVQDDGDADGIGGCGHGVSNQPLAVSIKG